MSCRLSNISFNNHPRQWKYYSNAIYLSLVHGVSYSSHFKKERIWKTTEPDFSTGIIFF